MHHQLNPPVSGSVLIDGQPLSGDTPVERVKRGMALVPEGRHLFPDMSVRENLELGGYLASRRQREEMLATVIGIFPRLGERFDQTAATMSGGEQQMLAIGRALMSRPRLLLLDEPSLGLALKMVDEIGEHVGLCAEFPSLSWLAKTPEAALKGIRRVVSEAVADMQAASEAIPVPLAEKHYSGEFRVRIPPQVHRALATEAAEQGVSLNRLASAKLAA
ncbi:MAG: ATP-binding cassette domain-containing protein [Sulfuritalea sp.]|nr:ATP-binding cassette domain-containing protein [Sulfuritalea sp.]